MCFLSVGGDADADRPRLDFDLERLHLRPVSPVELIQNLPRELDLYVARLRGLCEWRIAERARDCAPHHSRPVEHAIGGHDADFELSVVRTRVLERLDAAHELADVAEQDASRLALVPLRSV